MDITEFTNTAELPEGALGMQKLPRPKKFTCAADQARLMGLKIGDIIVGREGGGEDMQNCWWREHLLKLKFIGDRCCVWGVKWRSKALDTFFDDVERANWDLRSRDWYLVEYNHESNN